MSVRARARQRAGVGVGVGATIAVTALVAGALALLRSRSTFATVRGQSMSPTFTDGERVFAIQRRRYVLATSSSFDHPGSTR